MPRGDDAMPADGDAERPVGSPRLRWPLLLACATIAVAAGVAASLYAGGADREAAATLFATRLPDDEGTSRELADYRGRVLVVNFWATWCGPCIQEMPELQKIQDEYRSRGVEIIGIAIDRADAVRTFRQAGTIRYPLLVAGIGGSDLLREMGDSEGALPYTAVLSRSGKIAQRHLGAVKGSDLRHWLDQQIGS